MAIERFYNQTAQGFERFVSTPAMPTGSNTDIGNPFKCWINNRGGGLVLEGDKQVQEYDSTLKCDVSQSIPKYIRHVETGVEYRVVRINNNAGGYRGNHQTVYLEVNK